MKHIRQIDSKEIANRNSHLCYIVGICQANLSQLFCCKQSTEMAAMELRRLCVEIRNHVTYLELMYAKNSASLLFKSVSTSRCCEAHGRDTYITLVAANENMLPGINYQSV